MNTEDKCEAASNILEYIWYSIMKRTDNHSFISPEGDLRYVEEAQDIFIHLLDRLEPEVITEYEPPVPRDGEDAKLISHIVDEAEISHLREDISREAGL